MRRITLSWEAWTSLSPIHINLAFISPIDSVKIGLLVSFFSWESRSVPEKYWKALPLSVPKLPILIVSNPNYYLWRCSKHAQKFVKTAWIKISSLDLSVTISQVGLLYKLFHWFLLNYIFRYSEGLKAHFWASTFTTFIMGTRYVRVRACRSVSFLSDYSLLNITIEFLFASFQNRIKHTTQYPGTVTFSSHAEAITPLFLLYLVGKL